MRSSQELICGGAVRPTTGTIGFVGGSIVTDCTSANAYSLHFFTETDESHGALSFPPMEVNFVPGSAFNILLGLVASTVDPRRALTKVLLSHEQEDVSAAKKLNNSVQIQVDALIPPKLDAESNKM